MSTIEATGPARPTTLHRPQATLRAGRILREMAAAEPRFFQLTLLIAAAAVPTLLAQLVDERSFLGSNVWDKPLKFDFALIIYLATLAFFARYLPAEMSQSRRYRIYSSVVVVAIVAELLWIHGAAAMGIASHFNSSPVGAVLYSVMGFGALVLTSPSLVYAVGIARNRSSALPPHLREALVIGLGLTLPLTLITAGTMASMDGHTIGVSTLQSSFPFFGWARDAGDLRVSHFFGTHALHAIPLFALVGSLFASSLRWPVRVFAVFYVGFVAFTYVQALGGRPFLPFI